MDIWDLLLIGGTLYLGYLALTGTSSSGSSGGIMQTVVQAIAEQVANAEGFNVAGSIPQRANNPGDLELGDIGYGTLGQGITVYPDAQSGWNALYNEIEGWFGSSQIYNPSMTISQVASKYVGDSGATDWANNVAAGLGVTPDTTLTELQANYGNT